MAAHYIEALRLAVWKILRFRSRIHRSARSKYRLVKDPDRYAQNVRSLIERMMPYFREAQAVSVVPYSLVVHGDDAHASGFFFDRCVYRELYRDGAIGPPCCALMARDARRATPFKYCCQHAYLCVQTGCVSLVAKGGMLCDHCAGRGVKSFVTIQNDECGERLSA